MFTQDLEDMDLEDRAGRRAPERESGFVPAREARAERDAQPSPAFSGGNGLTEKQQNAILGYARQVFEGNVDAELQKMLGKRVEQLTKSEASTAIDRLRTMAGLPPNTR